MTHGDADVIVAGGGPVGLMLACELALAEVQVTVLERLTEVDTTIKAGSINTPSATAFYRRGLLPALAEVQREALEGFDAFLRQRNLAGASANPGQPPRFAGHFAGIMLRGDLLDADDPELASAGPADTIGIAPQAVLERLLAARADALGVTVRRGVELTGFDAGADGVTVRTTGGDLRAGWLVGCDGGRSTVRRLAGFPFPGTAPEITGHQAIVELTGADALGIGWNRTDTGTYAHGPFPGRILTVEFGGPPADREAPITAEELQNSLRHTSGVDVTVTKVHSATRFTDNARQVPDYRKGRVLLAGDAAHVHAPFSGQGLNLGIGDAVNLGWKLAATVHGWAPDGLLDTYTAERHPLGAWVLEWTRAQVALMRPEPHARALRNIIAELSGTIDATTFFAKKISGVQQRYDLPGDHPLTGRSAPDLPLADGNRLGDLMHSGCALLLDLADDADLRTRAAGYSDRVRVLTAACPERPALAGLLVRPDGCTAWAADRADGPTSTSASPQQEAGGTHAVDISPATLDGLDDALRRWFGAPGDAAA
ncbi:FAD-dependent oxidoreductase [Streptomyces pinistramenti]|uniref:FAD-dependent oxidoreductase n=1 Tax=Streptomyces pinistramenti TaxID=2884812 RepID=UPI001D060131|nr:FAD-dependent oxidoreductase [Streptomyces pinistramenti]MCB5907226.1 FAD-dependent oxidoreductase [Streptomyces pinistramenti]